MKKVFLGSIMFLAGLISSALILASVVEHELRLYENQSVFWNLSEYGLMPMFYIFIGVAIVGLAIAIWGIVQKTD